MTISSYGGNILGNLLKYFSIVTGVFYKKDFIFATLLKEG